MHAEEKAVSVEDIIVRRTKLVYTISDADKEILARELKNL
jgi:hypothetical protein